MLCEELMLKCVLAKPYNPLCDHEGMRVGGNDVDWVIPQGPTALGKTRHPLWFLHAVK